MNLLHKILWVGAGICVGNGIALIIDTTANKANAATYDTSNMTIPTVTYDMVDEAGESNGVLEAPDFSSITFRHLGSFSESGYISNEYDSYVGYALGRQWRSGDLVTDILKLGDIDDSLGVGKLTLSQIMAKSGRDPSSVTLEQIGLIDHQTVASFLKANPQLLDNPIKTIPPLADLVSSIYGYQNSTLLEYPAQVLVAEKENQYSEISLTKAVKQLPNKSSNPALLSGIATTDPKNSQIDVSELEMGNLDLNEYTLGDVEGIGDRFVEEYEGWKDEYLSDIEGLADISFDNFPNPIATTLAFISRVDFIWSDAHGEIKPGQSVSGSNIAGYAVPCDRECAHIELDDLENSGRDIRWISEGRRWMLGKDPVNANICPDAPWGVDGGEGVLGELNCGKEPTGRNPFGPAFKVALWGVDETTDTAETAIFFRFCYRGVPNLGCTPYFIGPIPFLPANRENWIILGPGL